MLGRAGRLIPEPGLSGSDIRRTWICDPGHSLETSDTRNLAWPSCEKCDLFLSTSIDFLLRGAHAQSELRICAFFPPERFPA